MRTLNHFRVAQDILRLECLGKSSLDDYQYEAAIICLEERRIVEFTYGTMIYHYEPHKLRSDCFIF